MPHTPCFLMPLFCMTHLLLILVGTMCGLQGWPVEAIAQGNRGKPVEITRFTGIKGQFVAARPGMIQWTDTKEIPYYVKILPTTYVQVLGQAEPDFLRPGMLVRFAGEIQGRSTMADPVEELTVFTPREGYHIGVFNDGDDPNRDDGPKLVAGQLKSIKNGKLTVVAGDQQIKAELAEEPTIKLDINDYSVATPGDEITITGMGFNQAEIEATGVEIQLSEKLVGVKKKKPARGNKGAQAPRSTEDDR